MPVRKRDVSILIVLLVVTFSETRLLSGTEGIETIKGSGALQLDPHFKPHLGTSYYVFELNGVNIGTGSISMQREGDLYKIRYEARTNDKVDHIFKARYGGEGIMAIHPFKPLRTELQQRVRSKTKQTIIYYEENGRIITTETKTEKGEEPRNRVWEARIDGAVLDPLSAVFLLQGTEWERGKEKVLKVYTGKARYEARFTCVDEVGLEISGMRRIAWVINQVSRNLDKKPEEQPEERNTWLRIYVSAEGHPDVLKVETTRKIGHVTLTLNRFEPAPDQESR
jgi:hypothetical protein